MVTFAKIKEILTPIKLKSLWYKGSNGNMKQGEMRHTFYERIKFKKKVLRDKNTE